MLVGGADVMGRSCSNNRKTIQFFICKVHALVLTGGAAGWYCQHVSVVRTLASRSLLLVDTSLVAVAKATRFSTQIYTCMCVTQ